MRIRDANDRLWGTSRSWSDLARQLHEDSPKQVGTHGAGVDVLLDGQAVGECQYHGHDVVDGEVTNRWFSTKELLDTGGNRIPQGPPVSDEPCAHVVVSDSSAPEVQEDQTPFPLFVNASVRRPP